MLLLIDNYDSFTYNLAQSIASRTKQSVIVSKNDQVDENSLTNPNLNGLILSPGPGRPEDAGNMNEILKKAIGQIPILGICLGHQAIGEIYGGNVTEAPELMHGKTDEIQTQNDSLIFNHCPHNFMVGRYHSLVIDPNSSFNNKLKINSIAEDGTIQGVSDDSNQVFGLEFHPESIMTDKKVANQIFNNFIQLTEA